MVCVSEYGTVESLESILIDEWLNEDGGWRGLERWQREDRKEMDDSVRSTGGVVYSVEAL